MSKINKQNELEIDLGVHELVTGNNKVCDKFKNYI
jgi:hypothetical protein